MQREGSGQVHRGRGLADTALLIGDRDDATGDRARPRFVAHVHDLDGGCGFAIERFIEKPEPARAREFAREPGYLWNSGMFMFRASRYLEELQKYRPDIYAAVEKAVALGHWDQEAFLSDGEAWSSSALALALGASQRTVQRAIDSLAAAGKVQAFGRGRARRWITTPVAGFATTLLLPAPLPMD